MADDLTLALGEARLVDMTFDEYLGHNFVSRSGLEDARRSPPLFFGKHVAKTIPHEPPTERMKLGTYVHMCTLEPEVWAARLYPPRPTKPPDADGRRKVGTEARDSYEAWKRAVEEWELGMTSESLVLEPEVLATVLAASGSIRAHSFGALLLGSGGLAEQTVIWCHAGTGLHLRMRLDYLADIDDTKVVLDLKTTSDPSPRAFATSVAKFGYHRQAALYTDAVQALYPHADVHYVLGVVRTSPPYETAFYQLESNELELGRRQSEHTMRDLVRRFAENDWRANWQLECQSLTLPGWAYHEE